MLLVVWLGIPLCQVLDRLTPRAPTALDRDVRVPQDEALESCRPVCANGYKVLQVTSQINDIGKRQNLI